MKVIKRYVLLFSVLFACQESTKLNGPTDKEENELIGTWKLIESSYSIGGPEQVITTVEDGEELTFSSNNTFLNSSKTRICTSGSYTYEIGNPYNQLSLTYACSEAIETFTYAVTQEKSGEITLIPINPACIEGCASKYRKLAGEGTF